VTGAVELNTERRRRPKDRKAQIARVAAETFSEVGYHGVSMDDIARRVGVTAASLYRHYSGKYELFAASVLGLGQQLVDCTAFIDDGSIDVVGANPEQAWDRLVAAVIDTALVNRASGGLYRWEGQYLDSGDQLVLNEQIKLVNRRLQLPMAQMRPDLAPRQRWILSAAVLSVLGSITDHHAALSTERIHTTLAAIAHDVRDTDLSAGVPSVGAGPVRTEVGPESGEYEQILHAAIVLFHESGYRETGMDDIAAAVGMSTTSLYRYFPGKATILGAAYRRAADRVSGDVAAALAAADGPRIAVGQLTESFLQRFFAYPAIAYVYYAERVNVPTEDRAALHNIQRATVDAWARQVSAARPGMAQEEARFAVHAGFALVTDLGRIMHDVHAGVALAVVRHLLRVALLGEGETQVS
jgi:AcrR family transcriptional regulator